MGWTYTGNDKLARAATRLFDLRTRPCRISPLVFMSDPERVADVVAVARKLPEGAAIIYRHFGSVDKVEVAQGLRQISFARNLQFLVGQDVELAVQVGADGVHLPERDLARGTALRQQYPDWLLTGAAHTIEAVEMCANNGLDAAILSPVFLSDSKSAGMPMGVTTLTVYTKQTDFPIFALGGVSPNRVTRLYGSGAAGIAGVSYFVEGQ